MRQIAVWMVLLMGVAMPSHAGDNRNFEKGKGLDLFNTIYKELDLFYVDTLDTEKVIGVGIDAMLRYLDPYTVYFREEDQDDLKLMTTGKYAGIGSIISYHQKEKRVVVVEPYEGMPAAVVGLKVGDILMAIDGKDLAGKTTSEVSNMLRGEAGTSLILTVRRPGVEGELSFKITRQNIQTPAIPYYGVVKDSIGYVNLTSFTDGCSREVRKAVIALKQQGVKALVLDLRDNPGGLMHEAVEILNLFLPKGTEVVRTKGKLPQAASVTYTTKEPLDTELPLFVLVDNGSASCSEIVAGALQDLDRAVIVGERTYGKGLVQIIRDLPYGGSLKVTTSKYYIPSGRCVQAINYKNRDAAGQPERIQDSLRTEFFTRAGRPVRDGGGVTPDIEAAERKLPTMLYYLYNDDLLRDFCTQWCIGREAIDDAQTFSLTEEDYAAFCRYLKETGFVYDRGSEKALQTLREMAQLEGYLEGAKEEFEALERKLQHNLDRDLDHFAEEIIPMLEAEIVKRYHYQRGAVIYALRRDADMDEVVKVLTEGRYRTILTK